MPSVNVPQVSVLMTSYNREKFIGEAIESVLASTFSDFELIIVDDASVDATFSIAQRYAIIDSRVKLFQNEVNIGQFRNRNKVASYAKGDFFIYLDSDDILHIDGIEKCIHAMRSNSEAGFAIYSEMEQKEFLLLNPQESVYKHFFERPILMHGPGATIIKKSVFHAIKGFPLKYSIAGDMYYNLHVAANTNLLLLPFRFVHYRIHEGQELNNRFDYIWANYNYLRDALNELPLILTKKEKEWLMNKNKRRLLVNMTRYFFKSFDISGLRKLIRNTNFLLSDVYIAINQKS